MFIIRDKATGLIRFMRITANKYLASMGYDTEDLVSWELKTLCLLATLHKHLEKSGLRLDWLPHELIQHEDNINRLVNSCLLLIRAKVPVTEQIVRLLLATIQVEESYIFLMPQGKGKRNKMHSATVLTMAILFENCRREGVLLSDNFLEYLMEEQKNLTMFATQTRNDMDLVVRELKYKAYLFSCIPRENFESALEEIESNDLLRDFFELLSDKKVRCDYAEFKSILVLSNETLKRYTNNLKKTILTGENVTFGNIKKILGFESTTITFATLPTPAPAPEAESDEGQGPAISFPMSWSQV